MLSKKSLCAVPMSMKLKLSSSSKTVWLIGKLHMSYHIIVKRLLMLCCVLKGLGASRGSMVANRDNRITDHIKQS